jgi:hypothetical protein
MSEKTLLEKLSLLANETPRFAERARVVENRPGLSALLDEVDVTVLPSRLHFETPDAQLALLVSGRTVVRLDAYDGSDQTATALVGAELEPEDSDQIADLVSVLLNFVENHDELRVRSELADSPQASATNRVTVAALNRTLAAMLAGPPPPDMEGFLSRAEPHFLGMLVIENGEAVKTGGDAISVNVLKAVLRTQLPAYLDAQNAVSKPTDVSHPGR